MIKVLKISGLVIIVFICIVGVITYVLPVSVKHLIHLIRQPTDLYEPILIDNFNFGIKNYKKRYELKPKYSDIYEVGLIDLTESIPSNFKLKGIFEIKIYYKDKLVSTRRISKAVSLTYSKRNYNYIKKIALTSFSLPLKGIDKNNTTLEITTIEPDDQIDQSIQLYVGISDIP